MYCVHVYIYIDTYAYNIHIYGKLYGKYVEINVETYVKHKSCIDNYIATCGSYNKHIENIWKIWHELDLDLKHVEVISCCLMLSH